jgi:transketolase
MIDGLTEDVMSLEPFSNKWSAFGFDVIEIDGHDLSAIASAFDRAWAAAEKPVLILANTVKGKGVDFMENDVKWHYGSADSALAQRARESVMKE